MFVLSQLLFHVCLLYLVEHLQLLSGNSVCTCACSFFHYHRYQISMTFLMKWYVSFTRKLKRGMCFIFSNSIINLSSWYSLIVHFDDELVSRFEDEDDFIIEIDFDNQRGHFDLYVRYWSQIINITCPWVFFSLLYLHVFLSSFSTLKFVLWWSTVVIFSCTLGLLLQLF